MDSVNPPAASTSAFHADEGDPADEYRSLSGLAIVSLLLGLAAPLSLLAKVFLLVPLIGIVLAVVALLRIASSEGAMIGRWPAMIGLALCTLCIAASLSREAVTRRLRTDQAEAFGKNWLEVLASTDTERAFRMTLDGNRTLPPPEPGEPPRTTTPFQEFLDAPFVKSLTALGKDAKIVSLGTEQFIASSRDDFLIRQRYRIESPSASSSAAAAPVVAELTMHHSHFPGQNQRGWLVTKYEPVPSPAN